MLLVLVAVMVALTTVARTAASSRVILDHVSILPRGWTLSNDTVQLDDQIEFSLVLRQPGVDIHTLISRTGSHLALSQVRDLRAPLPSDVDSVMAWLAAANIHRVTRRHEMVEVRSTIAQAEKLLDTTFAWYTYVGEASKLRATRYSVPGALSQTITLVHPISNFMALRRARAGSSASSLHGRAGGQEHENATCASVATPACLQDFYNMHYTAPGNTSQVLIAIPGFENQISSPESNQAFLAKYTPQIKNYSYNIEKINGGSKPPATIPITSYIEASLDLQYVMALAYPAQVTFYETGGTDVEVGNDGHLAPPDQWQTAPFLEFILALLDKPDDEFPHVIAVSYGDDEATVPEAYARLVCDGYGLLAARGATVIHASGDGGSAGGYGDGCDAPDPEQECVCRTRDGTDRNVTMATFPSGCPWITSVGATGYGSQGGGGGALSGAYFSSGGFSRIFARPWWQARATDAYVTRLHGHLDGYYDAQGRGIPDVATVGDGFEIIINGHVLPQAGTSGSAPLLAAMIALVNDARFRAGKRSLGFINEVLYSDEGRAALVDITDGVSLRCDFADKGWPATEGWDAITGLGVPQDFTKLMELLLKV